MHHSFYFFVPTYLCIIPSYLVAPCIMRHASSTLRRIQPNSIKHKSRSSGIQSANWKKSKPSSRNMAFDHFWLVGWLVGLSDCQIVRSKPSSRNVKCQFVLISLLREVFSERGGICVQLQFSLEKGVSLLPEIPPYCRGQSQRS